MRLPILYCLSILLVAKAQLATAQESDSSNTDTPIPTFSASPRLSVGLEAQPEEAMETDAREANNDNELSVAPSADLTDSDSGSTLETQPEQTPSDNPETSPSAGADASQSDVPPTNSDTEAAAVNADSNDTPVEQSTDEAGSAAKVETTAENSESATEDELAVDLDTLTDDYQPDLNRHQYQVEVVVFMRLDPSTRHSENWPENPGRADIESATEISAFASVEDPSQLKLTESYQRLKASPQYQTLLHSHWQQPAQHRQSPTRIRIVDDEEVNGVSAVPAPIGISAASAGAQGDPLDDTASHVWPVVLGTVAIAEERHLHASIDLLLTEITSVPAESANADDLSGGSYFENQGYDADALVLESEGQYGDVIPDSNAFKLAHYRMQHQKRIEPGKLHYFDHPIFGVLLQVELIPQQTDADAQPQAPETGAEAETTDNTAAAPELPKTQAATPEPADQGYGP